MNNGFLCSGVRQHSHSSAPILLQIRRCPDAIAPPIHRPERRFGAAAASNIHGDRSFYVVVPYWALTVGSAAASTQNRGIFVRGHSAHILLMPAKRHVAGSEASAGMPSLSKAPPPWSRGFLSSAVLFQASLRRIVAFARPPTKPDCEDLSVIFWTSRGFVPTRFVTGVTMCPSGKGFSSYRCRSFAR